MKIIHLVVFFCCSDQDKVSQSKYTKFEVKRFFLYRFLLLFFLCMNKTILYIGERGRGGGNVLLRGKIN